MQKKEKDQTSSKDEENWEIQKKSELLQKTLAVIRAETTLFRAGLIFQRYLGTSQRCSEIFRY